MTHQHTFLVWGCYVLGQVLHVLMDANTTFSDKLHAIDSYREYFRRFAVAIAVRFFVMSCLFPVIWDNPSAWDIQGIAHSAGTQIGFSGIIGYFSDSFIDKGLAIFGIKQKLPILPGTDGGTK